MVAKILQLQNIENINHFLIALTSSKLGDKIIIVDVQQGLNVLK